MWWVAFILFFNIFPSKHTCIVIFIFILFNVYVQYLNINNLTKIKTVNKYQLVFWNYFINYTRIILNGYINMDID